MPRGQRKSLEEKIQAKQELINALNIRIESEERELEELYEQKRRKELEIAGERELAHLKEPELYRPKVRNRINLMTGGRYTPGLFLCPFGYRQSCNLLRRVSKF